MCPGCGDGPPTLDALTSVRVVKDASFEPTSTPSGFPIGHRSRRFGVVSAGAFAAIALVLGGCGGGDDDSADSTTTTVAVTVAPTTTVSATTQATVAPVATTTVPDFVTEGAKLIVANASSVNGSAGRMTDALAIAGFSTGSATNSSEGQLETSKVYYDPSNADAEAVANSIRVALGGGAIQVLEMSTPAPVDTGELGDAAIVVAMGNDIVDKTLEELQGLPPLADTTTTEAAADG